MKGYEKVKSKDLQKNVYYYLLNKTMVQFRGTFDGKDLFTIKDDCLIEADVVYRKFKVLTKMKKVPLSKMVVGKKYYLELYDVNGSVPKLVSEYWLENTVKYKYLGKFLGKHYCKDKYDSRVLVEILSAWEIKK